MNTKETTITTPLVTRIISLIKSVFIMSSGILSSSPIEARQVSYGRMVGASYNSSMPLNL